MKIEVVSTPTVMIDDIPLHTFHDMLSRRDAYQTARMEQYVAQKCPEGYINGLKLGTLAARVVDLRIGDEGFDYVEWSARKDRLHAERDKMAYQGDNEWAFVASQYGQVAGFQQPLSWRSFRVKGLRKPQA